jgi:hypothetical protein
MTNNANDKGKDQFRLIAIAMQYCSLQPTTLHYAQLSYCEQWQLKPLFEGLLDRFQLEVEPDTQQEEPNKEQSETLDDEA